MSDELELVKMGCSLFIHYPDDEGRVRVYRLDGVVEVAKQDIAPESAWRGLVDREFGMSLSAASTTVSIEPVPDQGPYLNFLTHLYLGSTARQQQNALMAESRDDLRASLQRFEAS